MKVTVLNGQTLPDIALQTLGTVEGLMALALANDKSLTKVLSAGEPLLLPEFGVDQRIANYFEAFTIRPSTALSYKVEEIVNTDDPCDLCKYFK